MQDKKERKESLCIKNNKFLENVKHKHKSFCLFWICGHPLAVFEDNPVLVLRYCHWKCSGNPALPELNPESHTCKTRAQSLS